MNNFIKFKQDSGELTIMKRSAITAFHPKYTHGRGYIVYCSDGAVELAMFKTDTLEKAELWCDEQMEIIDGSNNSIPSTKRQGND